jgi:hypothetical protein
VGAVSLWCTCGLVAMTTPCVPVELEWVITLGPPVPLFPAMSGSLKRALFAAAALWALACVFRQPFKLGSDEPGVVDLLLPEEPGRLAEEDPGLLAAPERGRTKGFTIVSSANTVGIRGGALLFGTRGFGTGTHQKRQHWMS